MAVDPVDTFDVSLRGRSLLRLFPDANGYFLLHRYRVTGIFAASIPILMRETRSAVLLTRIAKKMRKETGDHRYRARVEDERASLKTLIYISCTRPLCKLGVVFLFHGLTRIWTSRLDDHRACGCEL